ncbi:hypothetical protein HAT2_00007 [Candidatus Similichlamydia laticola]|uniref:Uncharacterized protein n=1 Tax=Candidatus Similichlamydia laticola TaxID=2170265 RepID=A0A369KBA0_9BACT|nr:hypothetical protein HAT2_00007 [Candidatus Similichlamydia laticola]
MLSFEQLGPLVRLQNIFYLISMDPEELFVWAEQFCCWNPRRDVRCFCVTRLRLSP